MEPMRWHANRLAERQCPRAPSLNLQPGHPLSSPFVAEKNLSATGFKRMSTISSSSAPRILGVFGIQWMGHEFKTTHPFGTVIWLNLPPAVERAVLQKLAQA